MSKTDTVKTRHIFVNIDEAREITFTMRVLFEIETAFETVSAAFAALFGENAEETCAYIISICAKTPIDKVRPYINADNLFYFQTNILETAFADLPDADGIEPQSAGSQIDWDYLRFIARVKLRFSDREFWKITPRALMKYISLYTQSIGGGAGLSPKTAFIDELGF